VTSSTSVIELPCGTSGVAQGPEADVELTAVWTVRDGRILAADYFHDYAEALETLGLSE
jgi:ketosteroid isomerase-like protein